MNNSPYWCFSKSSIPNSSSTMRNNCSITIGVISNFNNGFCQFICRPWSTEFIIKFSSHTKRNSVWKLSVTCFQSFHGSLKFSNISNIKGMSNKRNNLSMRQTTFLQGTTNNVFFGRMSYMNIVGVFFVAITLGNGYFAA